MTWLPGDRIDGAGTVLEVRGSRVRVAWDAGGESLHEAGELFPEVRRQPRPGPFEPIACSVGEPRDVYETRARPARRIR